MTLSADEKTGTMQIKPVVFIDGADKEKLEQYQVKDEGVSYYILDNDADTVQLQYMEATRYYIVNWKKDKKFVEQSVNHCETGLSELDNPGLFADYLESEYGEFQSNYPLFMKLNSDGSIQYIAELMLP